MDTTSSPTSRFAVLVALSASIAFLGPTSTVSSLASGTIIYGGHAAQRAGVEWAIERFRLAALWPLPPTLVFLHGSTAPCHGKIGYWWLGRIDLCTGRSSEPYARKFALHEVAHAWTVANVDEGIRARFLALRDIRVWDDESVPWKERGFEQAAEIIAWGLGEGSIAPLLPSPATGAELVAAFVLLTGQRPLFGAANLVDRLSRLV